MRINNQIPRMGKETKIKLKERNRKEKKRTREINIRN